MIKELLNEEKVQIAVELCSNILSDSVTPEYIVKSLDNLSGIIHMIMPDDYIYFDLPIDISILIDDILEMTSRSDEEKQEAINRLIMGDMDEFTALAKDILEKIKSDEAEAQSSGYCVKLMKNFIKQ